MASKTIHEISFPGADGSLLAARLDIPVQAPKAFALFAHCFTCSKDIPAAAHISKQLAARGIATLRFDFTGLGHSGGEFANSNFSSNLGDLLAAADWLRTHYEAPRLLVGHSLGGAAILAVARRIPEAQAVATIGTPSDVTHVAKVLGSAPEELQSREAVTVSLEGREFVITRDFIDDLDDHHLKSRVRDLNLPYLILHSPSDRIVGIDHATQLFMAAEHPKSFVSLDGIDHLVSRTEDAQFVAGVIASWADRYVAAEASQPQPPKGHVIVEETDLGKFSQLVRSGKHVLSADEPIELGGDDTGPGPFGFLLAALGACTTMTLRMYAEHKGMRLGLVSVDLVHDRIPNPDESNSVVDRIQRTIKLPPELAPEVEARLLQIADRCPVHRTLAGQVLIETASSKGQAN